MIKTGIDLKTLKNILLGKNKSIISGLPYYNLNNKEDEIDIDLDVSEDSKEINDTLDMKKNKLDEYDNFINSLENSNKDDKIESKILKYFTKYDY